MLKLRILSLLVLFSFVLFSCGVDPLNGDDEIQSALDHTFAQKEFINIAVAINEWGVTYDFSQDSNVIEGLLGNCSEGFLTSEENGTFNLELLFNDLCLTGEGVRRLGKLKIEFSEAWDQTGVEAKIDVSEYLITDAAGDTFAFDGGVKMVRLQSPVEYHPILKLVVKKAVLTSGSKTIRWSAEQSLDWISGFEANAVGQSIYSLNGNAEGVASNDREFEVHIHAPLLVSTACPYILQGALSLRPEKGHQRTVDFGDGACNPEAYVSIEGFSRQIAFD